MKEQEKQPTSETAEQAAPAARKIKNRDILRLSNVMYAMQDVVSLEQRRAWQHDRMYSLTQNLSGMPGGKGGANGFDSLYAALSKLDAEQQRRIATYMAELREAEKIINAISSRTMRTFVLMMYVDCLPPEKVREELNMTDWGFRKARESVEDAADMQHVLWHEKYILAEIFRKNEFPS